ncbi:hypothetical protein HCU74_00165 [Spongiibacter sp. KMU-166]|uniref:SCP2 domain-containing protein n=1 Tax=Spongiibacter thalassae TaxID=2721624 RepID=A0ABX1GBP0_9GAMM|nr:hypothetical protein [Spongiibacter thalassae]NKI15822.1 hypothetical protein [Spongiibacter thalassae]
MTFLSDHWFDEYRRLGVDVEVPTAFMGLGINLNIKMNNGEITEASYVNGLLQKGHSEIAETTITASESLVYTAVVLGEFKSALPAYFSKKIKVEGEQAALVKLASVRPTESQKEFYKKLRKLSPSMG